MPSTSSAVDVSNAVCLMKIATGKVKEDFGTDSDKDSAVTALSKKKVALLYEKASMRSVWRDHWHRQKGRSRFCSSAEPRPLTSLQSLFFVRSLLRAFLNMAKTRHNTPRDDVSKDLFAGKANSSVVVARNHEECMSQSGHSHFIMNH